MLDNILNTLKIETTSTNRNQLIASFFVFLHKMLTLKIFKLNVFKECPCSLKQINIKEHY